MCLSTMTQMEREHAAQCISLVHANGLRIMPQRQTRHPEFNLNGVRTHDLRIMNKTVPAHDTLAYLDISNLTYISELDK